MKIITRQLLANEAPARFEKQYGKNRNDTSWKSSETRGSLIDRLNSLPEPINPDEVDKIIGNVSWTSVPRCDDCGKYDFPVVIQVGQEPDYESATANLCSDCLRAALDLALSSVQP